ncbi:MAG: MBL fold metallo-hydrolase [Oceanospirillaceae bacterium]|nr:MBL fold metallo-hydrolase [Oceanospirillaceae bacterium]
MNKTKATLLAALLTASTSTWAETPVDKYPESLLYSKPVQVSDNVWSAIGQLKFYTYENAGHNNNLSFVIGDEAVMVVNGSSAYLLAKALHDEIKQITDLPVKYVVDENGQTHASGGNNYWKEQGATIIAHVDAAEEIENHGPQGLERLNELLKERIEGSEIIPVDETFDESMTLDLGGLEVELLHLGPAHSAGDISVHVPSENVVIAGDIAFHQRMLPVFPETNTADWLETWVNEFTPLAQNAIIIPGHGDPTDFTQVDTYTRGYLEYLRGKVAELLDEGGTLADAYNIDQSEYMFLETADELAGKNAGRIFEAMEWE